MGYISLYTIDKALKEITGFTKTKTLYEKIFENDFKRTAWTIRQVIIFNTFRIT